MDNKIDEDNPKRWILLEGYLRNSEKAFIDGDFEWVVSLLTRAVELDPQQPALLLNRGMAHMELKQIKEALADFDRAVDIDNNYTYGYTNRAVALERMGDPSMALESYSKAISCEPENADLYYNRAVAQAEWGRSEDAIEDFNKAIELDPENSDYYNNRANAEADMGNLQVAIEDFTKAIEIDPSDTVLYDNRGITYSKLGLLQEALLDYEMSTLLEPRVMNKHLSKIEAEIILYRWEEARKTLERCRSLEALDDDHFNFCFFEIVLFTLNGTWTKSLETTLQRLFAIADDIAVHISWDYEDLKRWLDTPNMERVSPNQKDFLSQLITGIEAELMLP